MFKLDLEKAAEAEIKLLTSIRSSKEQESSRKTSISALLTMTKPFTVWITTNCKSVSSVTQLCLPLLRPHGLQHASLPCPSPSLGACSSSCPLSQWCHPNVSVQFSHSVMSNSATPRTAACQASLSLTISWSLLKLMSIESMMPSNYLICHPLLLLPSIFPNIRVFSNVFSDSSRVFSTLRIRWPKYWSFSFSVSPSNEYSGLISFRIDWFDLLAVQGTLKSLLQHHNLKYDICICILD